MGVKSPFIVLLVSGSLRALSTSTALLRTLAAVSPPDVEAVVYGGLDRLPHFNPDNEGALLPPEVAALRSEIRRADAILFSTPEYAGALPGSFKNLLDWTIGDDQAGSIYQKPVGWVNVSPHGAIGARDSLRIVLGYAHAEIVVEACTEIPVTRAMVGADGLVSDPSVVDRGRAVLADLRVHVSGN